MSAERGATAAEDDALGCYEEGTITRVDAPTTPEGSWGISYGDCWGCGLRQGDWTPKVGDHFRVYGRFGRPFHGQALNGRVLWYKTSAEMEADHRAWVDDLHARKRAEFEKARPQLDADYESLPPVLRKRINRFRAANPDFRWEHESYEMFVCTQAALLAAWAEEQSDPATAIDTWNRINSAENDPPYDFAAQVAAVPGWSDGHSSNTHGCAVAIAKTLVGKRFPEAAAVMPGALAPLVGSADYSAVQS
jgi:hypothetical protein